MVRLGRIYDGVQTVYNGIGGFREIARGNYLGGALRLVSAALTGKATIRPIIGIPRGLSSIANTPMTRHGGTHCSSRAGITDKIAKQMGPRGWTEQQIAEAMKSGQQIRALNKATGGAAVRYVHPQTGQSVVIDTVANKVLHVGGPGFKYGPASGDLP